MVENDCWQPEFSQYDAEIISSDCLYQGGFNTRLLLLQLKYKTFTKGYLSNVSRYVLSRPNSVCVLPYCPQTDELILVEQMRVGMIDGLSSPWILEPVAGIIENDCSPEETAIRESVEEAGCCVTKLIFVGKYALSAGISTEQCFHYIGLTDKINNGGLYGLKNEAEDIKAHKFSMQQACDLLAKGNLVTASTVLLLQWLKLNKQSLIVGDSLPTG